MALDEEGTDHDTVPLPDAARPVGDDLPAGRLSLESEREYSVALAARLHWPGQAEVSDHQRVVGSQRMDFKIRERQPAHFVFGPVALQEAFQHALITALDVRADE